MRLEWQLVVAIGLDLLLGDPRWFPHPVKLMGRVAMALEAPTRAVFRPRAAGVVTVLLVLGLTGVVSYAVMWAAGQLHPRAGTVVSILLLYTGLAARDLAGHSSAVARALRRGDLPRARELVSWMVGRDTACLEESGVVRAAVESVAENTVDGVTAPLFFAVLGGPVGMMIYKAVSTLDSTFGYRNERYQEFGWASARLDDVANFLPARLTAPLMILAAALLRLRPGQALRVCLRDRGKHASPNSGIAEAAMAGALGVQLGGLLYRRGVAVEMPTLGDRIVPLECHHIVRASALMFVSSALAAALLLGLRVAIASI